MMLSHQTLYHVTAKLVMYTATRIIDSSRTDGAYSSVRMVGGIGSISSCDSLR